MKKNEKEELEKLLKELQKWKHFFEILRKPALFVPLIIILIWLIDDDHINIGKGLLTFIKGLLGTH